MSITVAFLQGIASGLLIALFFVLAVGGLLFAVVFGRASEGGEPGRPGESPVRNLVMGRVLCATGFGFAVVGAFFVEVGTDIMGMVLGATGYYLGARTFGIVTIVLSTITFFVGLLAGQDAIPGSYDEVLNGLSRTFEK